VALSVASLLSATWLRLAVFPYGKGAVQALAGNDASGLMTANSSSSGRVPGCVDGAVNILLATYQTMPDFLTFLNNNSGAFNSCFRSLSQLKVLYALLRGSSPGSQRLALHTPL
jgi:hypothetical protein